MKRRLLSFALVMLALAGCAPPGTYNKIRKSIRAAIEQELGPADRYDVNTSHDPVQRLLDGRISWVKVHGINVRPVPGYIIDELFVDARNVQFNRHAKTVEGAEQTDLTGYVGDASLSEMLAQQNVIANPKVRVTATGAEISGTTHMVGGLPIDVTATGQFAVIPPATIEFRSQHVTAGGIPVPYTIRRSIDFTKLYAPLVLTGVSTEPGRAVLTGTIDWSKRR